MWKAIVSIVTIFLYCFTTVYALPFNNVQGQGQTQGKNKKIISKLKIAREKAALLPVDEASLSVKKKASLLGKDINALFSFVRDEIRFEPYRFRKRGINGVLMGKAGNSLEQALLLDALCKHHGINCRLVRGELSETKANTLIQSMFTGSVPDDVIAELNMETIADPGKDRELLNETREHYWLQYYNKTTRQWIDLDPSFKAAQQGQKFCESQEVFVRPPHPQRLSPELNITVHMEETKRGRTFFSKPLRFKEMLWKLNCEPIHLVNIIGREKRNDKLVVMGFQPLLLVGKRTIPGMAYGKSKKRTGMPDVFDKLGKSLEQAGKQAGKSKQEAEPLKLIRQWIEFTLTSPGGSSETWSYEVFYRSDLSAHAAILVNIFLSGVKISDDYLNAEAKVFIGNQHDAYLKAAALDLNVLTAEKPPANLKPYEDGATSALLAMMSMNRFMAVNHAYHSDRFLERMSRKNGVAAYYSSPRMFITTTVVGESGLSLSFDLNRNRARILAPPGAPEALKYVLHQARGFWECELENNLLERWTGKKSRGSTTILEVAEEHNIPFVSFKPDEVDKVDRYPYSDLAKKKIKESLRQGNIIAAPERMFTVEGSKTIAWWQFDGKTGEPVAVSENGRHQATIEWLIVNRLIPMVVIGALIFMISVVAGFYIGFGAAIAAEVECMNDPNCRDMEAQQQMRIICASALKKAESACYLFGGGMAAGFGIRRLFASIKACKRGARKALEMGGCQ